jgi:hypothetical protein
VTTAVCAPYPPPEEAATHAWELEAEIRRALDASTPLLLRVRALLDPRPLVGRPARVRVPAMEVPDETTLVDTPA